ncbi:MAG: B12-binding domain-containing radical SAM protein [Candidatus Omnitrophica bacterium]|nr:B12-binding domain-containing radical SAM protein [Candidatus Omnitrophota bacterium]
MIFVNASSRNTLKAFQPFLPVIVPLGIGTLVSVLLEAGCTAEIIDEQVEENTLQVIADLVKRLNPPFIFGFSVLTANLNRSLELAKIIKQLYPQSVVVFGGVHPSAMPDEMLDFLQVDYVVRGEADHVIVNLYRALKSGKDLHSLANLSYRLNGQIVHNPKSLESVDVNNLPSFPYHLFKSPKYDLEFVMASRGCPYDCIFCSNRVVTGKKYRFRDPRKVVDDLEMLYVKHNKRFIAFLDDNFLFDKNKLSELIAEIRLRGLNNKMTFSFQGRADHVSFDILKELYAVGFKYIFFGIESSDDKVLRLIKKNETVADCVKAVQIAKSIGFIVSATFIFGLPGETMKTRRDCLKMTRDLQIDTIRFNNATPYPGTELYEIAKREDRLNIVGIYENFNSVSTFIENPFKLTPFSYVPPGMSEAELRRDILFSIFAFYLDVRRFRKNLARPNKDTASFSLTQTLENVKRIPAYALLFFYMTVKFFQLFYFMVIKKDTALSLREFLRVFSFGSKAD